MRKSTVNTPMSGPNCKSVNSFSKYTNNPSNMTIKRPEKLN